jgi:hypothetical protein
MVVFDDKEGWLVELIIHKSMVKKKAGLVSTVKFAILIINLVY